MAKNIVLCSDGTGNSSIKGRGTNVFKLFEAVDLNEHRTNPRLDTQLAFYDDGVGTGSVLAKVIGGATGYGLRDNVKQLYRELSRVYDANDNIFLFGFSRGAFTVRTLAGMIGQCGILQGESFETARQLREAVDLAYAAYREKYDSVLTHAVGRAIGRKPGAKMAALAKHPRHEGVEIKFIGVWDTVDSVGLPFALAEFVNRVIYQFKFPTQTLGSHIEHAYHALSIDDTRVAFAPVLWSGPTERIDQVWFSGVHSNVGGGYAKQGMSLVALDWMLAHAERAGLRLQKTDVALFRGHASVDDTLYDPRAGLGMFYRWAPRDVCDYCARSNVAPVIHLSVAERIAHGTADYAPGNIPPGVKVVATPVDSIDPACESKEWTLGQRTETVERAINEALAGEYLLDKVRRSMAGAEASYWLFMASWACLLAGAIDIAIRAARGSSLAVWSVDVILAAGLVGLTLASAGAAKANRRMSDQFSLFWQQNQKHLRAALKRAKAHAQRAPSETTRTAA
jgi:uncharacterized protein (DUF2235 family)